MGVTRIGAEPRQVVRGRAIIDPHRLHPDARQGRDQRGEQLKYNALAADFARRRHGVTFLPAGAALMKDGVPDPTLFVDGVHMSDRGYRVWSKAVRQGLETAMPATLRTRCAARTAG